MANRFQRWRDRRSQIKRARKQCIEATVEATGWSPKEAARHIDDARERLGLLYLDYRRMKMYYLTPEEQKERYDEMLKARNQEKEARETAVKAAMEAKGWSREKAEANVDRARLRFKIKYDVYVDNHIYDLTDEEIRLFRNERAFQRQKGIVKKIMDKTGWTRDEAFQKYTEARRRTGCVLKEFFIYRFYELTPQQQKDVFLMAYSRKIQLRYDNRRFSNMVLDKEWTNNFFSDYLNRAWCMNTNITYEEFCSKFEGVERAIYKPAFGSRGKGAESVEMGPGKMKEAYEHICSLPDGVVEEFVKQHPVMNELTPASVNTIRIVTMSSKEKAVTADGRHTDIAYAALRIGGGNSIVDNFHSGGMAVAVDLETGKICTDAADMEGNVFNAHPVTGTVFRGFQIPYFRESVEMVEDIIREKEVEGYMGWDIAISEKGPVLIEVNTHPGAVLLSTPYAPEHKGMKPLMARYMW